MELSPLTLRKDSMHKYELKNQILSLEEDENAHQFWYFNSKRLCSLLINNDPDSFLSFDIIQHTMFVGNPEYLKVELSAIKDTHYYDAIVDNNVFTKNHQYPADNTTGNTIHHLYHLHIFEKTTGKNPAKFDSVLELGAGYGNTARLFFKLGFTGDYHIDDLPVFSLLQKYYLSNCVNALSEKVSWSARKEHYDLFIAEWSLSELPLVERKKYLNISTDNFLMSFGDGFFEVDNNKFFQEFINSYPDHKFVLSKIEHIPGQYYLIGYKK
jgi:SAM-dependent methyltransferase